MPTEVSGLRDAGWIALARFRLAGGVPVLSSDESPDDSSNDFDLDDPEALSLETGGTLTGFATTALGWTTEAVSRQDAHEKDINIATASLTRIVKIPL